MKGGAFGRLFLSLSLVLSLVPSAAWADSDDGGEAAASTIPADAEYVEDEIIVVYDDADDGDYHALSSNQVTEKLDDAGLEVEEVLVEPTEDTGTMVCAALPEGSDVEEAIAAAEEVAGVDYAQPNYVYKLLEDEAELGDADLLTEALTNDPVTAVSDAEETANQYYLYGDELDTVGIKGADVIGAWDYSTCSGSDIAIVVMDTGVNLEHEDLSDNILEEYCYDYYNDEALEASGSFNGDYYGHGTHVAGIAAAVANNGTGIAGASYNAKLIAYKVFDDSTSDPSASTSNLIEAYGDLIDLVESGEVDVRVVNLSLGSYSTGSTSSDRSWHSLITEAYELGVLTVCAGGNGSGSTPYTDNQYPSDWDECLAVTALDTDGTNIVWSDFNEEKDISAPGVSIYSTYNSSSSSYARVSGTSMASPLVAGIVALLFAANPDATPEEVVEAIESTATEIDDSEDSYHRNSTGYAGVTSGSAGAINAEAAVLAITEATITVPDDLTELYRTQSVQLGVSLDEASGEDVDEIEWSWSVENGTGSATISSEGLLTAVDAGSVTVSVEGTGPNTGRSFCASRTIGIQEIEIPDGGGPWATTGYADAITVSWNSATAATGYYVQRCVAGGYFETIGSVAAGEGDVMLSYEDEGSESGVTYEYRIVPYGTLDGEILEGAESDSVEGLRFDMVSTITSQMEVATRVSLLKDIAGDFTDTVYLVAEDDFPVALTAAGLAGNDDAAFFTIGEDGPDEDLLAALELINPYLVRIVYSEGAISDEVIEEIEEAVPRATVNSYSYEEANDAGEGMYSLGKGNWGETAFVVSGEEECYEDALSVAAYAYAVDAAVFTTNEKGKLSVTTRQNILAGVFTKVIIVGDEDAVSEDAEEQVEKLGVDWVRISGDNLYETSLLLAQHGLESEELSDAVCYFAPADLSTCLGAVSLAGYSGCPLLVIDERGEDVLSCVEQGSEEDYTPVVFFDLGEDSLSDDEKERIVDYVQGDESIVPWTSGMLSIEDAVISPIEEQNYTGEAIEPEISVVYGGATLVEGEDYLLTYSDNVDAGTATVTVTGMNDYSGSATLEFEILPADLSAAELSIEDGNFVYTGEAQTPALSASLDGVALVEGEDYTLSYSDNVDAGTATASITGTGNYTGSASLDFEIAAADLGQALIAEMDDEVYTGSALTPALSVALGLEELVLGSDYTVSYSDNVVVGTATVTITGTGNYTGSASTTFEIVAADIGDAVVEVDSASYTGSAVEPSVTVALGGIELTEGTDYTLEYSDNVEVGTAAVAVTGIGNYTGTASASFKIAATSINGAEVEVDSASYTGSAVEPSVTVALGGVELVEGEDYTLSYSDNVEVGTATVTVTGIGGYVGSASASFEIAMADLADAEVSLESEECIYIGAAQEPAVTVVLGGVELVEGEDYTLSYSDNVEVGTATVTVSGIGSYSGSASASFQISLVSEFIDVTNPGSWYYEAVYALAGRGYITGYTTGELSGYYGVGDTMSRAEFVTILWRIACPEEYAAYEASSAVDETGLSDLGGGKYYTEAVNWAYENGIVTGYASGEYAGQFRPNDEISFEQMCLVIARFADPEGFEAMGDARAKAKLAGFDDADEVSGYADNGLAWCVDARLVTGTDENTLEPQSDVTRERAATVIWRGVEEGLL